MPPLYLLEPGAVLRYNQGALYVTKDVDPDGSGPQKATRETLTEIELHQVDSVFLFGKITITTDAVHVLLENNKPICYFERSGKFVGRFTPAELGTIELRRAQFRALEDPVQRLMFAKNTVNAKLINALEVLAQIRSNLYSESTLSAAMKSLQSYAERALNCNHLNELLGIEGVAASIYFKALSVGFKGGIPFTERAQRPPPDPANALLSFGYVLFTSRIAGLLEARGFDPECGYYHEPRPNRPSLALDLLEELRHPLIDRFVMRLCNLKILTPSDFVADEVRPGGVKLDEKKMKLFFAEWETYLRKPLRVKGGDVIDPIKLIVQQSNSLASALLHRTPYQPFLFGS